MTRTLQSLALLLALSVAQAATREAAAQSPRPSTPPAAQDTSDDDLINPDRPGIADGSRVIKAGQIQLEVGVQRERHTDPASRTTLSFAPTLLRLGITQQLEARVESNTFAHSHLVADGGSVDDRSGLFPLLLGVKLALYDSRGDNRRSLGTIVRVAPPSGSNGFGTGHATGDVRLAADWDFAPQLSINPNVGVARYEGSSGELFSTALGALTLNWTPSARFNPFVDLGYQSREDSDGTWSLVLDGGLAYIARPDIQLDVSAGTGAHGGNAPHPFLAVGVSVRVDAVRHGAH